VNTVYVIDVLSRKVIKQLKTGNFCNGVTASPDGTRVFVTNGKDGTVSAIDTVAAEDALQTTMEMLLAELGPAVSNGATEWKHVRAVAIGKEGWVAAKFVEAVTTLFPADPAPVPVLPIDDFVFHTEGKMSTFGGPSDTGMSATEGLAVFETIEEAQANDATTFFLSEEAAGAPGLGRRLRVEKLYVACRWNYHETSRRFLQDAVAHVSANGRTVLIQTKREGNSEADEAR
jgi:hypothetical protein